MKLAVITPIWKRPHVFEIYKKQMRLLIDTFKIDFHVIIIGSEGYHSYYQTPEDWHYIEWFNIPLAKKFQKGLKRAKKIQADYVMILGSDDIISVGAMKIYIEKMKRGIQYIGLKNRYFYDLENRTLDFWPGYNGERHGEIAGTARCLSRKLLDKIGWKLWNTSLNTGLDRSMSEKLKTRSKYAIDCKKEKVCVVGVKTQTNINRFNLHQQTKEKIENYFEWFGEEEKEEEEKVIVKHDVKVINITSNDWANFAYGNYRAMQMVGINARTFKLKPHKYKYKHQSPVITYEQMIKEVDWADVVQIFFTADSFEDLARSCGKRVIVYHAGSNYRRAPEHHNTIWNPIAEKTVICLGEFHGLGAKNEHYLIWGSDLKPKFTDCEPLRIGHYPSNTEIKGTEKIQEMMKKVKGNYIFDCKTDKVTQQEHLARIATCDIYIELFKPDLWGKPYGSWGVTGIDAASMGKIVVTNHVHSEIYKKTYGKCGMQVANTERKFVSLLNKLVSTPAGELRQMQQDTRSWYIENHSLRVTGERIKQLL